MKNVSSISTGLMEEYSTTVYAPLGALQAAAAEVEAGDLKAARTRLQWVIDKSGHPEYDTLARIRLAGIELSEKNTTGALSILQAAKPVKDQEALLQDRFGDVYYAMGDFALARTAWEKAVAAAGQDSPIRGVLQYKLGSLPPKE